LAFSVVAGRAAIQEATNLPSVAAAGKDAID